MKLLFLAGLILSGIATKAYALDNGLAKTPPMGWNSWNKFGCKVDENKIKGAADALVATGMKAAGYEYVVIDDCWQVSRDEQGNIMADPKTFPSGIKALADYVHGKGLKFGIYSDAGKTTCAHRPGSRGYEFQDARQYAAWGVDFLKYDWCDHGTQDSLASYSTMRDALLKTGRPILFSLCEWGSTKPWLWAKEVGNEWRATGDIVDRWSGREKWGGNGMIQIVDQMEMLGPYTGPGHWNDPDMLEVGNGGMTDTEYRTHFSMWCLFAAPLMAGNDLQQMKPETAAILLNKEAIAVDQDALGIGGQKVRDDGDFEVWSKPLADGGRAVVLLNRSDASKSMSVRWPELGYPSGLEFKVRDLWKHADAGKFRGEYSAEVASHGVVFVRLTQ